MRRPIARCLPLLVLAALTALPAAAATLPVDDAPIFSRIDSLRVLAGQIRIDGAALDWAGFPQLRDFPNDAPIDPSRDLRSAALAPGRDELVILLGTHGRPSRAPHAFWIDVDFRGHQTPDLRIGLSTLGPSILKAYPPTGGTLVGTVQSRVAVGEVVEARISYAALRAVLPAALAADLNGASARSWVRIFPFSVRGVDDRQIHDRGPAAASYRLLPTPYALDPVLPASPHTARLLPLPLAGRWYVGQGAFGAWSHGSVWAYDLYRVDRQFSASNPHEAANNSAYYSWDQIVTAPVAGKVIRPPVRKEIDPPPFTQNVGPVNEIYLDVGANIGLWLGHFRNGTLPDVTTGATIAAGSKLGTVGNSGNRSWPHLHMGLYVLPHGAVTAPISLSQVRVSLNETNDDPWARRFRFWDVREGFLVQRM